MTEKWTKEVPLSGRGMALEQAYAQGWELTGEQCFFREEERALLSVNGDKTVQMTVERTWIKLHFERKA